MATNPLYGPLDKASRTIRVLRMHPSDDVTSSLRMDMEVISLEDGVEYDALSCVWGDTACVQNVTIGDHSVTIGGSLHTALRYLRKASSGILLWVDALCIHQGDMSERNHQVSMMGTIYRSARRVIAWLGEQDESSDLAFQFIESWADLSHDPKADDTAVRNPYNGFFGYVQEHYPVCFHPRCMKAFETFSERHYWQRLWIVQELELAKCVEFRCGLSTLWRSIEDVCAALDLMERIHTLLAPRKGEEWWWGLRRQNMYKMIYFLPRALATARAGYDPRDTPNYSLLEMLRLHDDMKTSEPRDKIFAVLGIMDIEHNHQLNHLIQADYSKSTAEVYIHATKYMILCDGGLKVMRYVKSYEEQSNWYKAQRLPTWVPDMYEFEDKWGTETFPRAAPKTAARFLRFDDRDRALIAKGIVVDTVKTVHRGIFPLWSSTAPETSRSAIQEFLDNVFYPSQQRGESTLRDFVNIITNHDMAQQHANLDNPLVRASILLRMLAEHMIYSNALQIPYLRLGELGRTPWEAEQHLEIMITLLCGAYFQGNPSGEDIELLVRMVKQVTARDIDIAGKIAREGVTKSVLISTTQRRFGLAPRSIQAGDELCYLAAYAYPLALRKQAGHYVFVGECRLNDLYLPRMVPQLEPYMTEFEIH